MQAPRWVLIWRSQGEKKMAAAVVQLAGWVLIWHMIEWFSTACCLYMQHVQKMKTPPTLRAPPCGNAMAAHLISAVYVCYSDQVRVRVATRTRRLPLEFAASS
jgi:hypothetical protein